MRDDTRLLIIRQFRMDWHKDQVAQLEIECLSAPGRKIPANVPDLLSADQIAQGLEDAAKFVCATADIFAGWAEDFAENPNEVQQKFTGLGDPNNQFWHGYWEKSLDFRYFPCHINKHTAKYEKDGTLGLRWTRAIDPKKPNLRVVPVSELKAEAARQQR